jgi:hypothetical protein
MVTMVTMMASSSTAGESTAKATAGGSTAGESTSWESTGGLNTARGLGSRCSLCLVVTAEL